MSRKNIDILNGKLSIDILKFALPIALSSILQQLFNSADTAIVGNFADKNALAAVGINGELVAFLVSVSSGLSVGVNVLIASYIGSGRGDRINAAIHSSFLFALVVSVCLGIVGPFISAPIMVAIKAPQEVSDSAALYLRIYFAGLPALLLYDFGSAVLRSRGDSRSPFIILVISGVLNILLNLFFVLVCHMAVAGVATATVIANFVSAISVWCLLGRDEGDYRFSFRRLKFEKKSIQRILAIGLPAALQMAVFCFANIFVQTSVNGFGTTAIDGSTISENYEYITYYIITAFGQTATTYISQNYSAGRKDRCKKILWLCIGYGALCCALLSVPIVVFRDVFASIFSRDEEVIAAAGQRIEIVLMIEPICSLYEVWAGYLRGMGQSTKPAIVTIVCICVFRIVWIETLFARFHTLLSLFVIFPLSWILTTIVMGIVFFLSTRKKKVKNTDSTTNFLEKNRQ